jgi:hypothetical protein|tara:strand:+ start:674 stop:1351 length:678 start_codon:yes stop_codon:yes gene_type:complete
MSTKGGVTPLKKRGGKAARKATAKKTGKGVVSGYKGRGGYKKSGGGKNPGGYNVHTRFKPRAVPAGPKGGGGGDGTTEPKTNKPYSFDENGDIVINNNNYINTNGGTQNQTQSQTQTQTSNVKKENDKIKENNDKLKSGVEYRGGEETNTRKSGGSFTKVWEENKDNFQDKWADKGGFEGWKKKAEEEIAGGYYTETRTVNGKKEKRTWSQKNDEPKVYGPWGPA